MPLQTQILRDMLRLIQIRHVQTYSCMPFPVIMRYIYYQTCLIMRLGINPKMPDKSLIAQTKKDKTFQKLNLSETKWIPEDPCGKKKASFGIEQT